MPQAVVREEGGKEGPKVSWRRPLVRPGASAWERAYFLGIDGNKEAQHGMNPISKRDNQLA
jgi:hypothetical protein